MLSGIVSITWLASFAHHAHQPEPKKGSVRQNAYPGFQKVCYGLSMANTSGSHHVVGNDKILVPPIELFKRCQQFGLLIPLAQQPSSEHFLAFNKVLILGTVG